MTLSEVMTALEDHGNPSTKKILMKHGAKEPFFGVKVQDLKKVLKKTKKNHQLALQLFDTGNSDAMYLAGLMADEKQMDKATLHKWADKAYWYMLSEYTVAWLAAESDFGLELGSEWIESDQERIASAGWATLSHLAALKADKDLPLDTYHALLDTVEKQIQQSPNRVRYTMNGFVIAVGSAITALSPKAVEVANAIGKVEVFMGDTSCKVPLAADYIKKIVDKGRLGKKRKTVRC